MPYFSAKFRVCWFIHLKFLVIFMKNSFHGPIQRALAQILENHGAHVKHFLMPHPAAKFQVSRFIHSRVLALFKKKEFLRPRQAPSPNFGKPWGTCQQFLHALPLLKISGLSIHPLQSSIHI